MKGVVFHDIGDIRLETVPDPKILHGTDAIIKITTSAICGTDLHMVRGTMPGMKEGTILGHEAVGVVEEIGPKVRNFRPGDRVIVPSTICCGYCVYCRAGYQAQCDTANPKGKNKGTAFYGGPQDTGPFDGLQAEYARIPFANASLVKLPAEVDDDQAILLSDIFPTGYFGAELAEIKPGNIVAVFGTGPVGLFAIISAQLLGADRILAVDCVPSRLQKAQDLGAEIINFNEEDPIEAIMELTGGIGADRVIDAVGVDASPPESKPDERTPSLALQWCTKAVAKAGTLSIIGVYPQTQRQYPIGEAMNKNLTIKMGNCNHRRYIPMLLDYVKSGKIDPRQVISHKRPLEDVIKAYEAFGRKEPGWIKVEINTRN